MIPHSRLLPLAAASVLLAGLRPVPAQETPAPFELPTLECWFLLPKQDRSRELANVQRQMRVHAREAFQGFEIRFYEQRYADQSALLSFFHYEDLAAETSARNSRSADSTWTGLFQQLIEHTDDETSFRSILLPVAGPASDPGRKVCRVFSRSRLHPFRRAVALRRARELVDHLNANYPHLAAYAYIDDLGDPYDLYLFYDYDALWERNPIGAATSWEATRRALLEDKLYADALARLAELVEEPMSEIVTLSLQ